MHSETTVAVYCQLRLESRALYAGQHHLRRCERGFLRLHKLGIVHHGTNLFNWGPVFQKAGYDIEREFMEEPDKLYYFRYPIEDRGRKTIATTRPETILYGAMLCGIRKTRGAWNFWARRRWCWILVEFESGMKKVKPDLDS